MLANVGWHCNDSKTVVYIYLYIYTYLYIHAYVYDVQFCAQQSNTEA